jgi:hypothetical protein
VDAGADLAEHVRALDRVVDLDRLHLVYRTDHLPW